MHSGHGAWTAPHSPQTFSPFGSLGRLQSGKGFEARSLLVTGRSGSGKTAEISDMLNRFNETAVRMPDGKDARFASCALEAKGSWKDLGRKTLHALGYPITNKTRRTQFEIWDLVFKQAKLLGVVGIYYDETQHIMRGKSDAEVLSVLDAFKTLMKSQSRPSSWASSASTTMRPSISCAESRMPRF